MESEAGHVPVLSRQVLALLDPQPGQICLDCTVGRAGHAMLIAPRLGAAGRYIGLDVDPENVAYAGDRLSGLDPRPRLDVVKANFATARQALDELGVGKVDLLLADLGFASTQMTDRQRGFSFAAEGPLDMRLDPELTVTAADLVNRLPEKSLADLIYRLGEERLSRRIARNIVEERRRSPIDTTRRLADVVRRAVGSGHGGGSRRGVGRGRVRIDPATRTFMALRIAVNAELEALERLLAGLPDLLAPAGKAAVISFHSLEDRLVKHAFADLKRSGKAQVLTKKPLTADEDEQRDNPRSRSAKLRAIQMGPDTQVNPI